MELGQVHCQTCLKVARIESSKVALRSEQSLNARGIALLHLEYYCGKVLNDMCHHYRVHIHSEGLLFLERIIE